MTDLALKPLNPVARGVGSGVERTGMQACSVEGGVLTVELLSHHCLQALKLPGVTQNRVVAPRPWKPGQVGGAGIFQSLGHGGSFTG